MNKLRCAFTGPGNTGKSTIIKKLQEDLSYSIGDNQWCKEYNVSVYPETARNVLDNFDMYKGGEFDMNKFQQYISDLEDSRLEEIKNDTSDILLIDRTAFDGLIYSIFNSDKGIKFNQSGAGDYDLVILFTEAFKKTKTEQFAHYNDERLVKLFRDVLGFIYGDKVVEFKNAGDIKDIKKLIYSKLNNR